MGVFDHISHRVLRRYGDTSALDEFSYHVPEDSDMRHARLEVDCFKKKEEYRKNKNISNNNNMKNTHVNSLESLKTDSDSDSCSPRISQEIDLCLNFESVLTCDESSNDFYPTPCTQQRDIKSMYDEYWDAVGKCNTVLSGGKCTSAKVLLYPEEEWAKNAKTVQWTIKLNRWWKRYCTVVESSLGGSETHSAVGKIFQNRDGTLTITGRFKRLDNPDFKLHLSARISQSDVQNGYLMTGALQQGNLKKNAGMEITHFAVIPKRLE